MPRPTDTRQGNVQHKRMVAVQRLLAKDSDVQYHLTRGAEYESRARRALRIQADSIADRLSHLLAPFRCHAVRQAQRRNAARLRAHDVARAAGARSGRGFQQELRHLRRGIRQLKQDYNKTSRVHHSGCVQMRMPAPAADAASRRNWEPAAGGTPMRTLEGRGEIKACTELLRANEVPGAQAASLTSRRHLHSLRATS